MLRRLSTYFLGFALFYAATTPFARAEDTLPCIVADQATAAEVIYDTPTNTEPVIPADVVTIPYALAPKFSEVLPDPTGDDLAGEFIEFHNPGPLPIDLAGWVIRDSKGAQYIFSDGSLGADGYLYLMYAETRLRLTNTAGALELRDPSGTVRDQMTYAAPVPTGKSYSKIGDTWYWVSPTPGTININTVTPAADPEVITISTPPKTDGTDLPSVVAPATNNNSSLQISISALLPNPEGDDVAEWVELRNSGASEAVLSGWKLSDLAGVTHPLDTVRISATGVVRILKSDSHISLNNTEEELRLTAPDSTVKESVRYEDAPSGVAFVRSTDGSWRWDINEAGVSDDAPNASTANNDVEAAVEEVGEENAAVSLADLSAYEEGETAIVEAVVTAATGVLGKTTFAIRDLETETGAIVRMYGSGPYTELKYGESVRIIGRVKNSGTIKLATTAREVTRIDSGDAIKPAQRLLGDVSDDDAGLEVAVSGVVAARGKRWITISDEVGVSEIIMRIAQGEMPPANEGDLVAVAGVVRNTSKGVELMAPDASMVSVSPTDIVLDAVVPLSSEQATETARSPMNFAAVSKNIDYSAWILALSLGAATLIGYAIWKKKSLIQEDIDGL